MKLTNPVKEKLDAGEACLGCFIGMYAPSLAEMAGYAGFDFVVIDNEHGPFGWGQVEEMVRACEAAGVVPIVRVAECAPVPILKALDRGARGIHIPQIHTAEDARRAVAACRFPPQGNRGAAYSPRSAKYGAFSGRPYIERSNGDIMIVAHIESAQAVESIEDIMEAGIDVAFIGPTDLSVSSGRADDPNHPDIRRMMDRVLQAGRERGVHVGILAGDERGIAARLAWGASYIGTGATSLIHAAFQRAVACKTASGPGRCGAVCSCGSGCCERTPGRESERQEDHR